MVTTLPPFAGDHQGTVPALQAEGLDVGAGGLGDPQAIEGEQADQGVLPGWSKPGGDQQRAEFVAVQPDSMRLVVHARSADVGGG
jgi:hypothetical protein